MELNNATPFPAAFTVSPDAGGREHLVVVVKGSFGFPSHSGAPCPVLDTQVPLLMADTFWGEPGFSAPRGEMDFAPSKPRCDILLEAQAHAPNARPSEEVLVGVRVGSWAKTLTVLGDRVWLGGLGTPRISAPKPFRTMPITYDRAFGGVDSAEPDPDAAGAFAANPVGRGWHRVENAGRVNGFSLPNVETPLDRVAAPWDTPEIAGFGPLGRGWTERIKYAGTYDDAWLADKFPFLPDDFDPRYHQAAPQDQQIEPPGTGTEVVLANLTSDGQTSFRLPDTEMPIHFARNRSDDVSVQAMLDTIFIEPETRRFSLSWRASIPLKRDIFEVPECLVGKRRAAFWRAREQGKAYYPSLGKLVAGKASS